MILVYVKIALALNPRQCRAHNEVSVGDCIVAVSELGSDSTFIKDQ